MNIPYDLKEKCGVFGIFDNQNAIGLNVRGLFALQHRGQEAAGIVAFGQHGWSAFRDLGLVSDVFQPKKIDKLVGTSAIGHVRYSTSGDNTDDDRAFINIQPLFVNMSFGGLLSPTTGNLTNTVQIREGLIKKGCVFQSTTDTEVILHLIAISSEINLIAKIKDSLSQIKGAYSLILLTGDSMIGIRDRYGFGRLSWGGLTHHMFSLRKHAH